jgi:hypothetical protein
LSKEKFCFYRDVFTREIIFKSLSDSNVKNMSERKCRNCGRIVAVTDGIKVCFPLKGYDVCIELKKFKDFLPIDCACGEVVKVYKGK